MSTLTERQMHDLSGRLTRLRAIDAEICTQIDELIGARIRLQDARNRYHRLHAETVAQYGQSNTPPLLPEVHGPRPGRNTKEKQG